MALEVIWQPDGVVVLVPRNWSRPVPIFSTSERFGVALLQGQSFTD